MDGEVPKDPWGNEFQYAYPPERGTRDFPDIWSLGPDGEDNTEDDITNWGTTGGEAGEEGFGGPEEGGAREVEVGGGMPDPGPTGGGGPGEF